MADVETTDSEEVADGFSIGTWNDGFGIEMPALQIVIMLPVLGQKNGHRQRVHLRQIQRMSVVCTKFEWKNNSHDVSILAPRCQQLIHTKLYHQPELQGPTWRNQESKRRVMIQEGGLVPLSLMADLICCLKEPYHKRRYYVSMLTF